MNSNRNLFVLFRSISIFALPALLILLPLACKKKVNEKLTAPEILNIVYGKDRAPAGATVKAIKRVNLDVDLSLETVARIQEGQKESIVLLKRVGEKWRSRSQVDFKLNKPGTFSYKKRKGYVADPKGKSGVILRMKLAPVGVGVKFNSVIIEFLSDEGGKLLGHLMILTKFDITFDSRRSMAAHPPFKKAKRVNYQITEKGAMIVFPEDEGFAAEMRFNGLENVLWYPGDALPFYHSVNIKSTPDGTRDVQFTLRNNGGYAVMSYISFAFPGGGKVKAISRKGARVYNKGGKLFHKTGGGIYATYPLLEVTKRGWRAYYRTTVKFRYTPGKDEKNPEMLVRVVNMRGQDKLLSPGKLISVDFAKDQQGYSAYKFPLNP